MASADSLGAMMDHIQTMEEAMVSVMMEAIMKQSAVIDATILIVVDGPRGRKWAGRKHLRDAYLEGNLTSLADENEIVVETTTTKLALKKEEDASGRGDLPSGNISVEKALTMMETYVEVKQEQIDDEDDDLQDSSSSSFLTSFVPDKNRRGTILMMLN